MSTNKRQRAIAKRLKRKSARDRLKARTRREYNQTVRAGRRSLADDSSDLLAPIAIAFLTPRIIYPPAR